MKYISVCSGIEAATVAWHPLGWEPVAFAEIDAFPSAVLKHHFPTVPNLGDISKVDWRHYHGTVDLVVGGTPCQGFSIAGQRGGLDDARSGLAMHFVRLLREIRPRWAVWENVPGCLSTNGGRDFGAFLKALDDCGYGLAWRVLDAKHWGVAQQRRRVFLVGHFGDVRPAGAVLFEPEAVRAVPESCGSARQKTPGTTYCIAENVIGRLLTAGPQGKGWRENLCFTLNTTGVPAVTTAQGVRRITPVEAERLMGFPDGWTDIPWRGNGHAPDGPRYKALGNSMAVPCMRWIGERINNVETQE